jgi:hypothetical protein
MDAFKASDGSMTASLVVMIALMAVSILLGVFLREPKIFLTESAKDQDQVNT